MERAQPQDTQFIQQFFRNFRTVCASEHLTRGIAKRVSRRGPYLPSPVVISGTLVDPMAAFVTLAVSVQGMAFTVATNV